MNQLEVVKDMYAAFQRGDIPRILSHLREDVEWEHDSLDHGIPWLKPGRGHAHVASFFKGLGVVDLTRFELVSLLEGPAQVAAFFHVGLQVKSNGRSVGDLEGHLWSFDSAGKVARFRHFADTHAHFLTARS